MSTRVVLAEDHQMVREGLRSLLEHQDGIEVVGEATDGRAAVCLVRQVSPTVVVMDVSMPGLNGVEATRQIVAEMPGVKVIGLSMHADKRFIIEMLKAGASGYLLKASAFDELVGAISAVVAGQVYLSPRITALVVDTCIGTETEQDTSPFLLLTPREREVLQLLAEGKHAKEIARLFQITRKTVDTHRQNIMNKLRLHSLADLIKYAVKEGLISLDA